MKRKWMSNVSIERIAALTLLASTAMAAGAQTPIRGGEIHHREVELESGAFFHAAVEQQGVDLALALIDGQGLTVGEVDSPNGPLGPEELGVIVSAAGVYRLEVRAAGSAAGHYVYRELARRPATAADREWIGADRRYHILWRRAGAAAQETVAGLEELAGLWRRRGLARREADTRVALCQARLRLGDHEGAAEACARAIDLYSVVANPHLEAVALRYAAVTHIRLGEARIAADRARGALALSRAEGNREGVVVSLTRLGTALVLLGELQAALDVFDEALEVNEDPEDVAWIAGERAAALFDLHRPEEAFMACRRAAATYRQLGRPVDEAMALKQLAEAALRLGDLARAEEAVREALALVLPEGSTRDRALVMETLGRVALGTGDREGARRAYLNAIELFRDAGDARGEAVTLTDLGVLELELGRADSALARHWAALELHRENGDARTQAISRVRGAQALTALERHDEAWTWISRGLERVEAQRGETARRDFRLSYFAARQEYYDIALDILVELHRRQPTAGWDVRALALHDRRLARDLVDAVLLPRREVNPRLAAAEREWEERLRALAVADPERPLNAARQGQINAVLDRLYQVRGRIRQAERTGRERNDARPELDVARIQALLGDEDLVLIYSLGDRQGHLFLLTREGLEIRPLAARTLIEPWVDEWVSEIRAGGDGEPRRRLTDLLVAPFADRLECHGRLIVVADGALQRLPFAALLRPDGATLLEHHEVVMLPSLSRLLTPARRPAPTRALALIADPVVADDDPRLAVPVPPARVSDPGADAAWPETVSARLRASVRERLPGTRQEAFEIRDLISGEALLLTGFEVERDAVLAALAGHRVVHLATHGLSHPRSELSALVLSLYDEAGRPVDGFLHAFEIARLDLAAELVVLAACETGLGEQVRGEGTLGLAYSFLHAGAARVVASLWSVGDAVTARLMTRFYAALAAGEAPAAALRRAQLALAAEPGATAFDWAGFTFRGDWRWQSREANFASLNTKENDHE